MYVALTLNKCEIKTFSVLQLVFFAKTWVSRYLSVKTDIDYEMWVFKNLNKTD